MCMLEMATLDLEIPCSECDSIAKIYKKVTVGVKPEALSKVSDLELKAFIEKCIDQARQRPLAADLIKESFLSEAMLALKVFLNKACIIISPEDITPEGEASHAWSLCTVDQVEELKSLIRVIPLWSSSIMMSVNVTIVEHYRKRKAIESGYYYNPSGVVHMLATSLVPQHLLSGVVEGLTVIASNEFFYSELPKSMSSIAMSLSGLGLAVGSLLASLILSTVADITKRGGKGSWISSNINRSLYESYYWLLAVLSSVNLLYFLLCSWAYGPCADQGFSLLKDEGKDLKEEELPTSSRESFGVEFTLSLSFTEFNLGSLVLLSLSVCLLSFPAPGIYPERHIFDILSESPDPSEQDKRTIIVVDPSGQFRWYSDLLGAEIALLKSLKNEFIIVRYRLWRDDEHYPLNCITEACISKNLRDFGKKHCHVSMKALRKWSRQTLKGLDSLHTHVPRIIHRDLKCSNIFINGNVGKIGDLGLTAIVDETHHAHSLLGTPEYMVPELECDSIAKIYKKVTAGVKPQALNKVSDLKLKAFIEKCIDQARERPSAADLIKDPFLSEAMLALKVHDLHFLRGAKGSWISNNINISHYESYYWLLAVMSSVNLLYFLLCSWPYGPCADQGFSMLKDEGKDLKEEELPTVGNVGKNGEEEKSKGDAWSLEIRNSPLQV
ncbi:hypothetical protein RHSIM_Rhsim12G0200800 [Rhododendron simsii]|uniref:non-specific serine/threonine protein kinase n=1 Tax=Rhododendron simsii TaxID=118357 RepID=A0A834G9Q3_RHOSS|nr:hypothetical protein RHSIM_Rhsim12G0200800 [Rhododendron simsii]